MNFFKSVFLATTILPLVLFADSYFLNDGFDDGDRTTQNLSGSAAWYATSASSGTAEIVDKGAGEYALGIGDFSTDTPRGAVAYFTDNSSTKVTLGTAGGNNSTLQYSFDFTTGGAVNTGHAIRMIVADSDSRISTDELGDITAAGYMISLNPGTGEMTFRTRTSTSGNYLSSLSRWANMDSSQTFSSLTAGTTYSMTIDIERLTGDDVKLTATISDGTTTESISYTDDTYQVYDFDTVGFANVPDSTGGQVEFDNVQVGFPSKTLKLILLSYAL